MTPQTPEPLARRRRLMARAFELACLGATLLSVVLLFVLLGTVLYQGLGSLTWDLLTRLPSRLPERAGIKAAALGSLWLIGLTTLISVPVGVGAAIYLEEYARDGRLRRLIQLNIANLAGVPSIVYGILGLGLFVRALALDRSVISGALTLSLVILPVVILTAQEALRSVPVSIRHASYALGATRWQTIWHQVLPVSIPGILTGVILAVSRALGEAAPLVAVGAVAYVSFVPSGLRDAYTALPIQIFDWSQRPQREFHDLAAAAIIVLLAVLLCLNGIAVYLRQRYGKRVRW
ncbi:MAG: phosphate ABC transporter permease PstA [Pirellulales bacterium]|nr:phosphate ABC transporter permease PstA [Pirellulales bacterium]